MFSHITASKRNAKRAEIKAEFYLRPWVSAVTHECPPTFWDYILTSLYLCTLKIH